MMREIKRNISNKHLQTISLILFIIGATSMYLWSLAYGGIINLVIVGSLVRASAYSVVNGLAFFKHPVSLLYVSTFLFFILIKLKYHWLVNTVLFLCSFMLTVLYLLADDSRMAFAVFFFVLFLLYIDAFKIGDFTFLKAKKIAISLGIVVIFLMALDTITNYVKTGEELESDELPFGVLGFIGNEFSYIYSSGQHAVNKTLIGDCPYLFWEDIKAGIYAWFPESMKPQNITKVWAYNTDQFSPYNSGGATPTDFVTTMIYDLGFWGPLIFPIFWGWIIKRIDLWYIRNSNVFNKVLFASISLLLLRVVNYNMLYDTVLGSFYIVVALILWHFYRFFFVKYEHVKL